MITQLTQYISFFDMISFFYNSFYSLWILQLFMGFKFERLIDCLLKRVSLFCVKFDERILLNRNVQPKNFHLIHKIEQNSIEMKWQNISLWNSYILFVWRLISSSWVCFRLNLFTFILSHFFLFRFCFLLLFCFGFLTRPHIPMYYWQPLMLRYSLAHQTQDLKTF